MFKRWSSSLQAIDCAWEVVGDDKSLVNQQVLYFLGSFQRRRNEFKYPRSLRWEGNPTYQNYPCTGNWELGRAIKRVFAMQDHAVPRSLLRFHVFCSPGWRWSA